MQPRPSHSSQPVSSAGISGRKNGRIHAGESLPEGPSSQGADPSVLDPGAWRISCAVLHVLVLRQPTASCICTGSRAGPPRVIDRHGHNVAREDRRKFVLPIFSRFAGACDRIGKFVETLRCVRACGHVHVREACASQKREAKRSCVAFSLQHYCYCCKKPTAACRLVVDLSSCCVTPQSHYTLETLFLHFA